MSIQHVSAPWTACAFIACVFLGGCASGGGALDGYAEDPEAADTLPTLREQYFGINSERKYYDEKDAEKRTSIRNETVFNRMRVYDMEFSRLRRGLNASYNVIAVGSDLTGLLLNTIAAVTGSASTKAALSAAAGGIIGARGVVDKDLYYQQTLPAIVTQMSANREKAKAAILIGLKEKDEKYPLGIADQDLARLNDAGNLSEGVTSVIEESKKAKKESDATIQGLQASSYAATTSSLTLRAWLYPGGKVDQSRLDQLQGWLNGRPDDSLHGLPPAYFVSSDEAKFEAARQDALKDSSLHIK